MTLTTAAGIEKARCERAVAMVEMSKLFFGNG